MVASVRAVTIQNHGAHHPPEACPIDQIVDFVHAFQNGKFMPTTESHLRHEGKSLEAAISIQRCEDFLDGTNPDSIPSTGNLTETHSHFQRQFYRLPVRAELGERLRRLPSALKSQGTDTRICPDASTSRQS